MAEQPYSALSDNRRPLHPRDIPWCQEHSRAMVQRDGRGWYCLAPRRPRRCPMPEQPASQQLPRAVAEARITCASHPWQAEGRLWDGPWFYLRIRSGHAGLGLGATLDQAVHDEVAGTRCTTRDVPWVPTDAEAWALFDRLLTTDQNTPGHEPSANDGAQGVDDSPSSPSVVRQSARSEKTDA